MQASEAFGPVTEVTGEFFNWEIPIARLPEALEFAFADEKRPKQALGPVSLYIAYSFVWKAMPNLAAGELSEHFRRGNRLGVSVGGRKVFIQPTFLFNANDRDKIFVSHLQALEAALPFSPRDDYYCRSEPKKTGEGENLVKLHKGWKDAA